MEKSIKSNVSKKQQEVDGLLLAIQNKLKTK